MTAYCIIMPRNVRADESVLHPATAQTTSLRVTVPAYIVAKLELKKGDRFRWHIVDKDLKVEIIKD
jgi:hypothetical protein